MATWEVPGLDPANNEAIDDVVWARLRHRRDTLLVASDWTQVADAACDKAAWAEYRQALRDLPANTTDPREAVWPTPPAV